MNALALNSKEQTPGQKLEALFLDALVQLGRGEVIAASCTMKAVEDFCLLQPPLRREEHVRLLALKKRFDMEASLQRMQIQQDMGKVGRAQKAGSAYRNRKIPRLLPRTTGAACDTKASEQ